METIKSMEIDEENQYGLYKIEGQDEQINKTYSNHNAILINLDFIVLKKYHAKRMSLQEKDIKDTKQ